MSEIEFNNQLLSIERSLLKFAYIFTQKKEDAKDLVQETLLKGLLNRDKYVNIENFKAWIFTILRNTFINNYRRYSIQNTFRYQTEESSYIHHAEVSGSDDPHSAYSFLEMTQIVEQLNEKFRIPFKMHFQGYKYQEIAEALNLNIGTVKSRIFLSRKKLQKQLDI
jgi:RNA polymerase sigma-70 factor (ECF subfamily)